MSLAFAGLLAASPAQAAQSLPRQYQFLAILIEFPDEDMQDIHLDDADALEIQSMIAHECGINKGQPYQGNREYPIAPMDQFFSKYSYGKINVNWSRWPRNAEGNVVSYTAPQSVRRYLPWSQNNMKGYSPSVGLDRFRELFNGAVEAARPQIEQAFTKGEIDVDGDKLD